MLNAHKLCKLTEQEVAALLTATGHVLSVADINDILDLDQTARRIEKPDDPEEIDILNIPVRCGSLWFSKPSIQKLMWFSKNPAVWFHDDPANELTLQLCMAWLLTQPNDETWLPLVATRALVEAQAESFAETLVDVDRDDLDAAIDAVLPQVTDPTDKEPAYGPTCALLAREYGSGVHYWFAEADIDLARAMLADYRATREAELASVNKSRSEAARHGGKAQAPVATPTMYAQRDMRVKKNALLAKWTPKPTA